MSTDTGTKPSRGFRSLFRFFRLKKSERKVGNGDSVEPPLPLLPRERRRPLTPTVMVFPDMDSTSNAHMSSMLHVSRSPIFMCLPPELRRSVLIEAFGERTLHLDLRLTHPLVDNVHNDPSDIHGEHGCGKAPFSRYAARDYNAPKIWRWWSCECHRSLPPSKLLPCFKSTKPHYRGFRYPKHDRCIRGEVNCCPFWSPDGRRYACSGCTVGAMGWLLACRQA